MLGTRRDFSHDNLLKVVSGAFSGSLARFKVLEGSGSISNRDCLMSGLAVFGMKSASLLQFNTLCNDDAVIRRNIAQLYGVNRVPCDTYMRERLDAMDYEITRAAFTRIFSLLQRGNIVNDFKFLDQYYLVSVDGTGYFSSSKIHCEHCCVKESKTSGTTYYHQMLCGALVCPGQKVVFPFAPEPIINTDGNAKNDCERNAAKRWLEKFRREHPHLPVVIVADGLSSNAPFIRLLQEYNIRYILVCKEDDHTYLTDWVKQAVSQDAPRMTRTKDGITSHYQWMENVPLNASTDLTVSVLRLTETRRKHKKKSDEEITTSWMWVTDLPLNENTVIAIAKGGRSRWKIENETFNTLKNQGYNFEHNYGHGNKYLSVLLAHLMLLAFFIDQILQLLDKSFIAALQRTGSKSALWERMRGYLIHCVISSFEAVYKDIAAPPQHKIHRSL